MERLCRGIATKSLNRLHGNTARCPSVAQCHFSSSSSASSSSAAARVTSRRLYRILQRQCAEFAKALPAHNSGESMFLVQPGLNPMKSGSHRILTVKTVAPEDDVRNLLVFFRDWNEDNEEEDAHDWYEAIQSDDTTDKKSPDAALDEDFMDEPTMWTTVSSIQNTIRHAFRHAKAAEENPDFRRVMNKYAICAVRMLMEQEEIWRRTSVSYDKDIRVVATSRHIGRSHMGPRRTADVKNRFNYRMRIENLSDQESVQLLGRYWHIQELEAEGKGGKEVGEPIIVDAPNSGAVGQLPVLGPGDAFEYMSGCELGTSRGEMAGSFHFAKVPLDTPSATLNSSIDAFASTERFEVEVTPFSLEATTTSADSD